VFFRRHHRWPQSLVKGPALSIVLAFILGLVNGLRTFVPITVIAWCAKAGLVGLGGSWAAFLGTWPSIVVLTVLALAELVADKLPRTPSRREPLGLGARFVFGGLSGTVLCTAAGQSLVAGAVLGAVGGVAGCYIGYAARVGLVRALKGPDWPVALLEDAVAILLALFIVTRV
jgi:uncharacterized membrane protein